MSKKPTHYVLWGNACEILSNVVFQALTLDIPPRKDSSTGIKKAIMSKRNHFHHYSRSTEPPEIIRRHHRNLPGRAVQIVSFSLPSTSNSSQISNLTCMHPLGRL